MRTFVPIVVLLGLSASVPLAHEWLLERQQRRRVTEESQIHTLRQQLSDARATIDELHRICEKAPEHAAKLQKLELSLATVGTKLANFDQRVDSSIRALNEELHQKTTTLEDKSREGAAKEAAKVVEAVQADVKDRIATVEDRFREDLKRLENIQITPRDDRDIENMRRGMLAPIVQLNGDDTVGSGVLIYSQKESESAAKDKDGAKSKDSEKKDSEKSKDKTTTIVLSSWHVVRNIMAESGEGAKEKGIRVNTYATSTPTQEICDVVAFDEDNDLVLLKMRGDRLYTNVARILPPAQCAQISVFTPIYAVGCPLGNDPIPTGGEVASLKNNISNHNYWMINAPTYFGNSGGGVFLAKTHELVGIFSKIYTHGSGKPTVIPHMGLATPMDTVAPFLEKNGYGFILKNVAQAANAGTNAGAKK